MAVEGITQAGTYTFPPAGLPAQDDPAIEGLEVISQQEPPAPAAPGDDEPTNRALEAVGSEDSDESDTGASGVLRLLQDGHFKGVADVRLRINFHEEIIAAQTETAKSAAQEALTDLSNSVNAQLEQLASPENFSQE